MMKFANIPPGLWAGQVLHLFCVAVLLTLASEGWRCLNSPVPIAFWTAIAFPVAHQVFVWLAWRLELRSGSTSRVLGFRGYLVVFFVLFAGRFVSLIVLAWMDRGSLGLSPALQVALASVLAAPGIYAIYSVQRYFGMARAAADHFDSRYRSMPLVKKGIFRFTNNGMYLYAFLLFWAIAVGFDSSAALLACAFSHAYIWVHFFATERPDMRFLYCPES